MLANCTLTAGTTSNAIWQLLFGDTSLSFADFVDVHPTEIICINRAHGCPRQERPTRSRPTFSDGTYVMVGVRPLHTPHTYIACITSSQIVTLSPESRDICCNATAPVFVVAISNGERGCRRCHVTTGDRYNVVDPSEKAIWPWIN